MWKFIISLVTFFFAFSSEQMILVLTKNWDSTQGQMQLFKKRNGDWVEAATPKDVVVGKNGLAWGIGLHKNGLPGPRKKEGDGKAPAGQFSISSAFGKVNVKMKMPYLKLTANTVAVDDPNSTFYNQIVQSDLVKKDWKSEEKMFEITQYRLGLVVDHNLPVQDKQAGSCIFIHDWSRKGAATAGCTAMSKEDMNELVSWLDPKRKPVLVQLPVQIYKEVKEKWKLPQADILLDESR